LNVGTQLVERRAFAQEERGLFASAVPVNNP